MPHPEVAPLLGLPWSTLGHRSATARLRALGWDPYAEGDWALVYRSPGGSLVARVSPFEPAYGWFVELCRRCPGNPYLPRIELATELEGGGQLTVLEHLHQAEHDVAAEFLRRFDDPPAADADLRALRAEVDAIQTHCRATVRHWGDLDLDVDEHVLTGADGRPKLIDPFFVAGEKLFGELLTDPDAFLSALPPEWRRYLFDLPHFGRDYAAADLRRYRAALERAAGVSP